MNKTALPCTDGTATGCWPALHWPDLVLLGPHGAGKTTLGRALATALNWPFHPEIGRQLAEDPTWRAPDRHAGDAQAAFDTEVCERELARDQVLSVHPRIVETWHPGNLAYARLRSPDVAQHYEGRASLACQRPALAIALDGTDALLADRQSEPGPLAFFAQVGRLAPLIAVEMGIPLLIRLDAAAPIHDHVVRVMQALHLTGAYRLPRPSRPTLAI